MLAAWPARTVRPDPLARPAWLARPDRPARTRSGSPRRARGRRPRAHRPARPRPAAGGRRARRPGPARADRPPPQRLEQGRPLPQHPLVVGPYTGVAWRARDQQVVEKPAALLRVALDQGQVLGREQDGAQHPEHLAGAAHRRTVEPGPVGPAGVDLDLDQAAGVAGGDRGAQDGPLGPGADQRCVGRHPVRAECRDVCRRLDQVGLALPVGAEESAHPRLQAQLHPGVGPEIGEGESGQVHTRRLPVRPSAGGCAARARAQPPGSTAWAFR